MSDRLSGLVSVGCAAFVFLWTFRFPPITGYALGPAFFPRLISLGLFLCGLLLLARRGRAGGDGFPAAPRERGALAVTIGLSGLYLVALEPMGFVVATFLYVVVLTFVMRVGRRDWRVVAENVAIAVAVVAVVYMLFRFGFRVPLPRGWFG